MPDSVGRTTQVGTVTQYMEYFTALHPTGEILLEC